jgi:hypothetical protein
MVIHLLQVHQKILGTKESVKGFSILMNGIKLGMMMKEVMIMEIGLAFQWRLVMTGIL